ncbi:MAG TPA: chemotaxis protein CheA [Ruminiclostridium sp.]
MSDHDYISQDPMLEMFVFETLQLIEQLEEMLIVVEKNDSLGAGNVNEIFRIMHTIKGSSAMMMFDGITTLAHSLEDLFSQIRDKKEYKLDCARLTDIVLQSADFIKGEIAKIQTGETADLSAEVLIHIIKEYLLQLKGNGENSDNSQDETKEMEVENNKFYISNYRRTEASETSKKYVARIYFQDGCQMENIRAYTIVHNLKDIAQEIYHEPQDIIENEHSIEVIRGNGFTIYFNSTKPESEIWEHLDQTLFLEKMELKEIEDIQEYKKQNKQITLTDHVVKKEDTSVHSEALEVEVEADTKQSVLKQQNIISVNLNKLDILMDLVGEIVISEAMVTGNPDLDGLMLDNFNKAARQLIKLTSELQDIVMSIRMIPVAVTFHKMQRIVRDMNQKLGKDVELKLLGEETEVDKNIIDHLSDPLMHLIRNALDHGVESREERLQSGKQEKGSIVIEAKNAGGDVWITVKDDGRGLNKSDILKKAKEQGILNKPEGEYSEKEIYSFILLPGFSTKESVSEFSGRGVGMDVVRDNIEKVRGSILIDSVFGCGTTIAIKIPMTLAIIDGMLIAVGKSRYIIPTTVIKESFRAEAKQIIEDTNGKELIMLRGQCYVVIRIHRKFDVNTQITNLEEGIIVVVEDGSNTLCLFADELLGQQQVVVKPIPPYIKKSKGLAGCTIQGDGSISLILDVNGILEK